LLHALLNVELLFLKADLLLLEVRHTAGYLEGLLILTCRAAELDCQVAWRLERGLRLGYSLDQPAYLCGYCPAGRLAEIAIRAWLYISFTACVASGGFPAWRSRIALLDACQARLSAASRSC
jgi:hypothetical protein